MSRIEKYSNDQLADRIAEITDEIDSIKRKSKSLEGMVTALSLLVFSFIIVMAIAAHLK